jgi:hypothetical protein
MWFMMTENKPEDSNGVKVLKDWEQHTGQCAQCRRVMEMYLAEMPQTHQLCAAGLKILTDYRDSLPTKEPTL